MADFIQTDSMLNVKTQVGLILNEFLNQLEGWAPELAYVYDESLTYETGLAKYRADKIVDDNVDLKLPIFIFNRSVLRPDVDTSIGKRSLNLKAKCTLDSGEVERYRPLSAKFDLNFLYVTRNIIDMERFEISYLLETSVSHVKRLDVDIPEIGQLQYFLRYGELDDKVINIDDNYYKALTGTFTVQGLFFSFQDISGRIEQINGDISDYDVDTCTPTETLGTIRIEGGS